MSKVINYLKEKEKILKKISVFSKLEPVILDEIILQSEIRHVEPGQLLIKEGAAVNNEFYVLIAGELEVFKHDAQGRHYSLNTLSTGQIFGEGLLLGEQQRASSVQAAIASDVLVIPNQAIEKFITEYTASITQFFKTLHAQTVGYLKKVNEKTVELIAYQKSLSFFLINIVVFLSVFSILVSYIQELVNNVFPAFVTTPLVFIGSILLFIRLRKLGLPLSVIGITTHNLGKVIFEAIWISLIVLLLIVAFKFCVIHCIPGLSNRPLFYTEFDIYRDKGIHFTMGMFIFNQVLYVTHAIFQEIIARGSTQGMFMKILPQRKGALAIILASLVFASAHSYFGIWAVLAVFFPGLFWGWLYARQGNIFGVIVSHIIIGLPIVSLINF